MLIDLLLVCLCVSLFISKVVAMTPRKLTWLQASGVKYSPLHSP